MSFEKKLEETLHERDLSYLDFKWDGQHVTFSYDGAKIFQYALKEEEIVDYPRWRYDALLLDGIYYEDERQAAETLLNIMEEDGCLELVRVIHKTKQEVAELRELITALLYAPGSAEYLEAKALFESRLCVEK
ncbi:hypothetical protein BNJ_00212 [Kaumoebavirus]|uniref:hypothetical protein n=1 Tax=Kaumoebavirus TaxID=1859492 RepID=UPI0009C22875|nr:hypothetical protein BNJ_00212 [Kaumoebavirus]ARA72041.1 hypothetical protein BNJ_00212 [Kaumoebavirus]